MATRGEGEEAREEGGRGEGGDGGRGWEEMEEGGGRRRSWGEGGWEEMEGGGRAWAPTAFPRLYLTIFTCSLMNTNIWSTNVFIF